MSLSRREVDHIAHLARLALSEDEAREYGEQLSRILQLVDQLQAVDTRGVEPLAHPLDIPQRLREDLVTETDHREEYQRNAPQAGQGLYLVPRVIE